MRSKLCLFSFLILHPSVSFSQEANPAEKSRASEQYRNNLLVFNEGQIFPVSNQGVEIYRVLIAPTFYHPLSIRIEKDEDANTLVAKRLSGLGGYGWGTLKREKRRRITEKEWQELLVLINQASFWTLTPEDKDYEPNEKGEVTICLDGTSWFLEGVNRGKYHAVRRYCPESSNFRAVGL